MEYVVWAIILESNDHTSYWKLKIVMLQICQILLHYARGNVYLLQLGIICKFVNKSGFYCLRGSNLKDLWTRIT